MRAPPELDKRTAPPGMKGPHAKAVKVKQPTDSRTSIKSQDYIAVPKSALAEIRVRITEWRGEKRVDVREFTATIPNIYMSTASGLTLTIDKLPALIDALQVLQGRTTA